MFPAFSFNSVLRTDYYSNKGISGYLMKRYTIQMKYYIIHTLLILSRDMDFNTF